MNKMLESKLQELHTHTLDIYNGKMATDSTVDLTSIKNSIDQRFDRLEKTVEKIAQDFKATDPFFGGNFSFDMDNKSPKSNGPGQSDNTNANNHAHNSGAAVSPELKKNSTQPHKLLSRSGSGEREKKKQMMIEDTATTKGEKETTINLRQPSIKGERTSHNDVKVEEKSPRPSNKSAKIGKTKSSSRVKQRRRENQWVQHSDLLEFLPLHYYFICGWV
eukprot:TRINITY_DN4273_c0_g1_i2.p1 TRINITY_DN4273_c0_g1~~TRINITY_DN4273_c0_g1_i2.p1  ORF type:complete len:219 (-),score=42.37 TRINITY_DN4273_c0_g1_i2:470-1126(-)